MRIIAVAMLVLAVAIAATGCANVSAPYVMKTERTDQKVEGNRGYLKGTPPPAEDLTGRQRPWLAVDVDLVEGSDRASAAKEEANIK